MYALSYISLHIAKLTGEHAKSATSNFQDFEVLGIFTACNFHIVSIYTFMGSCQFFMLQNCLSLLQSCGGLKFGQLKAYLFIQDKNQSTYYFEMCSPDV